MPISLIKQFLKLESSSGILLLIVTVLAIVATNSPLAGYYNDFLSVHFSISLGTVGLDKPLLLWINDGLMATFFLLVGLELKREMLQGQLRGISNVILPAVAAIGGIVVPALIYLVFTHQNPIEAKAWAIPTATDIAFALGVLSLFGSRVPLTLKLFLTALAIIDDVGAISIIAIFHSNNLSVLSLSLAAVIIVSMILLNKFRVRSIVPYALLGLILWVCVLKSGVHATLAGVVVGFIIPLNREEGEHESPLEYLEEKMHPWVAYLVMPLFAFANAGVSFSGINIKVLFSPVVLGIVAGLFIGKQLGIFLFSWVLVKLKLAKLPEGCDWLQLYAVSLICGIGFTMSLFIGSLAFSDLMHYQIQVRLGVIIGSLISGVSGGLLLVYALKNKRA